MSKIDFSILITTKDRVNELRQTLESLSSLLNKLEVELLICDDGSTDDTSEFIKKEYPNATLIRNERSKGLIFSRNRLMDICNGKYAISLDDDLNFISENPLEIIRGFFEKHQDCAVVSFRIYWDKNPPESTETQLLSQKVNSFAGGAHAWKMEAWKDIDGYPDWFIFYGEEKHASFQLFKKNWSIYYLPEVLTHHRVDLKARKSEKDYVKRTRRSIRSGWYLYCLFFPLRTIPKRLFYTVWIQFKTKVFKGDFKALLGMILAKLDLIYNLPKLIRSRNSLSFEEWKEFNTLPPVKLYWQPNEEDQH